MSSDKKEKKQKRKDKKSRQRAREKRGKLPPSVEALLQYLGGGGPAPAPQGDLKVKERAGVDNIDTLSQIIKQQQIQNASYMQNLQQMAWRTDVQQQLTKQDEKLTKQKQENIQAFEDVQTNIIQETKATVDAAVRKYTFKPMDEKIEKVKKSILHEQRKKKEKPNPEKLEKLRQDLLRLEGLQHQEEVLGVSSYQPPLGAQTSTQAVISKAPTMRAGGGIGDVQSSITNAQAPITFKFEDAQSTSTLLNAVDTNAKITRQLIGNTKTLPPMARGGGTADFQANIGAFASNVEGGVSSGTGAAGNMVELLDMVELLSRGGGKAQKQKSGSGTAKKGNDEWPSWLGSPVVDNVLVEEQEEFPALGLGAKKKPGRPKKY